MNVSMGEFKSVQRQLAWDMIHHGHMYNPEVQHRFGLTPASPEVMDMEHADSDCRLHAVDPIYHRIWELSGTASVIGHRAMLNYLGEDDLDDDDDEYKAILGMMTSALTVAVISALLAEGRISLNTPEGNHG